MAIKRIIVTDGFLNLRVDGNEIIFKQHDNEPIDALDDHANKLLTFYRELMNNPEKVNPELAGILKKRDYFDGKFISIQVYTCGTYYVTTSKITPPQKSPLWEKFFGWKAPKKVKEVKK